MVNALITAGELLIIFAYSFRKILVLRSLACLGSLCYVLAALSAGYSQPGMAPLIFFSSISATINFIQIIMILKEQSESFLPEDLREIHSRNFQQLNNNEFMKIYHLAQEIKYRKGDIVIEKNHKLKHLLLMINGSVDICDHDQVMAQVLKGNFLGEMSYISNNKTTASAYVNSDEANCLLWNRTSLQQLELDDNPLYNKFLQSISQNLVEKLLASSSLKMKSEHLPNGK